MNFILSSLAWTVTSHHVCMIPDFNIHATHEPNHEKTTRGGLYIRSRLLVDWYNSDLIGHRVGLK